MVAESNVGARLTLIGKTAFLAGIKEAKAAVVAANAEMAASSKASAEEQVKWYGTLEEAQVAYRAQVAATTAANLEAYTAFGKKAAIAVGAAGAIIGYESLKIHSQFQSAMLQSQNLAGVAASRMGALTAGIKNMAPAVGQGLVPLANALYRIASTPAGLKATNSQLLNMVRYSAMLATIGGPGTDLEQTARIIGAASTVGAKGTGSPKDIVNLAAATVGSGDIRMSDFVDFLGTGVMTSGKLTGVTMPQIGAFLALAGSNLQSGQVSGHALAHGLMMMAAPNPTAQKAMGAIGLSPFALGDTMRTKGLGAGVHELYGALSGPLGAGADTSALTKFGFSSSDISAAQTQGMGQMGGHGQTLMAEILTRMFGGAKMGIPLNMLVTENSQYNQTLGHIQGAMKGDLVDKAMARQMDTLSGKTKAFTSSLQVLADTIGTDLTPIAKAFLVVGTDVANVLGRNKLLAGALGITIGVVLGPAIALWGIRKFSDMAKAISDVVRGFGAAVQAIVRFVARLIGEDAALAANDLSLTTNTKDQAANDAAKGGGLAGLGKFLGGASTVATAATLGRALTYTNPEGIAAVTSNALIPLGPDPKQQTPSANRYIAGIFAKKLGVNKMGAKQLERLLLNGSATAIGTVAQDNALDAMIEARLKNQFGISGDKLHNALTNIRNQPQTQHVTNLHLDGKQITTSVQKQTRAMAARN